MTKNKRTMAAALLGIASLIIAAAACFRLFPRLMTKTREKCCPEKPARRKKKRS
jgi:hypothetical protein